jgi:hypothetical protein
MFRQANARSGSTSSGLNNLMCYGDIGADENIYVGFSNLCHVHNIPESVLAVKHKKRLNKDADKL